MHVCSYGWRQGGPLGWTHPPAPCTCLPACLTAARAWRGARPHGWLPAAGYESVISVAAVDQHSVLAPYSTTNSDVELAGPGSNVLSTWPLALLPFGCGPQS